MPRENYRIVAQDDLELRLATTLAPMLLAIAVFAMSAVSLVADPKDTIIDEMLSMLAAFCILSAATLIDFVLDKLSIDSKSRVLFLNGGYILFCGAVGFMTMAVPILYSAKQAAANQPFVWDKSCFIFLGAGGFVFMKMMTFKDHNVFIGLMVSFFIFSGYVLWH